ncbi:MAG: AraC family transcriptional regulator [Deltaproteobacteria bacterium]|nr:MAG: AraC family transcriptional regulator [Deltaproteobacteria bacterium]
MSLGMNEWVSPATFDVLGLLMKSLKFQAVFCCQGDFYGAWAVEGSGSEHPIFHYVRKGPIVLTMGEESLRLDTGDLVVLPGGCGHRLGDGSSRDAVSLDEVIAGAAQVPGTYQLTIGAEGEHTGLYCGVFFVEQTFGIPGWSSLPSWLHLTQRELSHHPWLPMLLEGLSHEAGSSVPGGSFLATKMAEMVFLLAFRYHVEHAPSSEVGWAAALQEPRLSKALWLIHSAFGQPWTLAQLAKEAGLSRTLLATQFKDAMGMSPMSYLNQVRMLQARQMLMDNASIKEVAHRVGFASTVGFHNAFKRTFQTTPGACRNSEASSSSLS